MNDKEQRGYEEFEELLNQYLPVSLDDRQKVKVIGKIAQEDRNFVYLDAVGQATDIRVRKEELSDFTIGDEVEVIVIGETEDGEFLIGSRKRIEMEEGNKHIDTAFESATVLKCKVIKKINGGYILEFMKQQGFLPNSLSGMDEKTGESVVGKDIEVIVKDVKTDKRGKKIIFSRKDIIMKNVEKELEKIKAGDFVEALVIEVLAFGINLKIGNLRGFVHISEIAWNKIDNLAELYKIGEIIKCKVLSVDLEKKQLKLSVKELTKNPWELLEETYKIGDEIKGRITRVVPYGAFMEIVPGVEGLIHVSDFTWNTKKINIGEFIKVNDIVTCKLIEMEPKIRKIKLGIKQLSADPWEGAEESYVKGTKIQGTVADVKEFGVFIEDEKGITAFIHQSDLNWLGEEPVKLKVGDKVEYSVVEIDCKERKLKGSLKALRKSPWENITEKYNVGDKIERPVKTIIDSGLFINIQDGIDGFVPVQMASKETIKNLKELFKVGEPVLSEIVEINNQTKKIKLSIKKIEEDAEKNEEREMIAKYAVSSSEE